MGMMCFCSHQVFWRPYLTGLLKLERLVWGGDCRYRLLFAKRQKGIFNLHVGFANSSIISLFHVVQARREFYIKNNVHPFKSYIAILSSAPIWITVSLSLRTMSGQFSEPPFPGFSTEGGVWFTNLCMSDPTYTLPVLLGELVWCLHIAKCKFHYKIWPVFMTRFAKIVIGNGNVMLASSPHHFGRQECSTKSQLSFGCHHSIKNGLEETKEFTTMR